MTTFKVRKVTKMPRLLTYAEVAERFGFKVNTLYSLVRQRRIPHVRLGKRFVRFPLVELVNWVRAAQVAGGTAAKGA